MKFVMLSIVSVVVKYVEGWMPLHVLQIKPSSRYK